MTQPTKITRELFVVLTEDEVSSYSKELARVTSATALLEDEKKASSSAFKDKIDRALADSRALANKITTQKELRPVECHWSLDFKTNRATLYRSDTGETIESRDITEDERQKKLFDDKKRAN